MKDRLGIRHRKASKNARALSDLETAPMFREPHARSASELTLPHLYEPTRMSPESSDVNEKRQAGYADDSLEIERSTTTPPPLINVGSSEMVDVPAIQVQATSLTSRHASYYSSSDIPPPSPIPPSLYRFANGEIGEKSSHSRAASSSSPTSVIPSLPEPGYGARSPSSMGAEAAGPESFEMHVRHAPSHSQSHSRFGSQGFRQVAPGYAGDETYSAVGSGEFHPDEASRHASTQSWTGAQAL